MSIEKSFSPLRQGNPAIVNPLATTTDLLLADVAIRVQLSFSNYRLAVERYETLRNWVERDASPLKDKVELFYPQGSMAINATIASKLDKDDFDVDVIVQTNHARDVKPERILDDLLLSIKGEEGSQYYKATIRNTRCVTVEYADMHIDFTPAVLLGELPERSSYIFHHNPDAPKSEEKSIIANPYGFAEWFKARTPVERIFAEAYEKRSGEYDVRFLAEKAEAEELPEHTPGAHSMAVVALQLLKRWRNVQYDKREGRKPPSVMMAKFVAEAAGNTTTLSDELLFQAEHIRSSILKAHRNKEKVRVMNPACEEHDCFTDRWPKDLADQELFLKDLDSFIPTIDKLKNGNLSLDEQQALMVKLFGERPTLSAFENIRRQEKAVKAPTIITKKEPIIEIREPSKPWSPGNDSTDT